MAQEQFGLGHRIERRSAPRHTSSHQVLTWGLGLAEGALASLTMLVPALLYHAVLLRVPANEVPFELYGAYSTLVGVLHGAFSVSSASRFLTRSERQHNIVADAALGWTAAFAIALFGAFLAGVAGDLSRVSLSSAYLVGVPVLLFARNVAYARLGARISTGRLQYQKVSVIGARGDVVRFLLNGNLWKSGYQLAGTLYVDELRGPDGRIPSSAIVEFAQHWLARGSENIVFVGELGDIDGLERIVGELKRFAINVVCAPATSNTSFKFLDVVPIGPNNALRFLRKPMSDGAVLLKRAFDLAGASLGLLLLAPLLLLVAVLIKLDSRGPVFYRQERRGFNGETFFIWKFRSMTVTESGRKMTQVRVGDRRITRVGAIIRKTSIDELPQLFNVLRGEMSLVGPRPHALVHDDELGEQLASYAHRQRIKPGITGWAQVNGYRGETTTFEQIEGRTRHDLYYIDNWSIFFDCWIVILTVFSPKTRRNAV